MKWTILKEIEPYITKQGKKQKKVLAQCECGIIKEVIYSFIKTGRSKSCGCEIRNKFKSINTKHTMRYSSEYRTWCNMKTRCTNPNFKQYNDYGGRGITICKEWIDSFENFIKDMGLKPGPRYSIDRINVNGNYEPSNCRWATFKEQRANQR